MIGEFSILKYAIIILESTLTITQLPLSEQGLSFLRFILSIVISPNLYVLSLVIQTAKAKAVIQHQGHHQLMQIPDRKRLQTNNL